MRTAGDVRVGGLTLQCLALSNGMGSEDVEGKSILVTWNGQGDSSQTRKGHSSRNPRKTDILPG